MHYRMCLGVCSAAPTAACLAYPALQAVTAEYFSKRDKIIIIKADPDQAQ